MTVRLLPCSRCGHMMRFGASECGQCGAPAGLANRASVHVTVLAAVVVAAIVGLALLAF